MWRGLVVERGLEDDDCKEFDDNGAKPETDRHKPGNKRGTCG